MAAKSKPCPICGDEFMPRNSLQKTCYLIPCAKAWAVREGERKRLREARREKREFRRRDRSTALKAAQRAFNAFIRERDKSKRCISCGTLDPPWTRGGAWDAGHYRTRAAAPELRFEPLNVHKQCKSCNAGDKHHSGKGETVRAAYRENLIGRIGLDKVEWLEGPHEPKHYTVDDLLAIASEYRAKLKELRA